MKVSVNIIFNNDLDAVKMFLKFGNFPIDTGEVDVLKIDNEKYHIDK